MTFLTFMLATTVAWNGLDESGHLGGRRLSEGYMQGKVVLVDRFGRNCPPCRALLPRLEQVWRCYKCKPFVLLGGHCVGWGETNQVKDLVKETKITYPVYQNAGLAKGEPRFRAIPFLYVVDATGEVVYQGHSEQDAEEAVVNALTNLAVPPDETYWRKLIDRERDVLPGLTLMHLDALAKDKKYAALSKSYAELHKQLKADGEIAKLAKLEAVSRQAKDYDPKNRRAKVKFTSAKIDGIISQHEALKQSKNPLVVQEAKNCLADLAYASAALKGQKK